MTVVIINLEGQGQRSDGFVFAVGGSDVGD